MSGGEEGRARSRGEVLPDQEAGKRACGRFGVTFQKEERTAKGSKKVESVSWHRKNTLISRELGEVIKKKRRKSNVRRGS